MSVLAACLVLAAPVELYSTTPAAPPMPIMPCIDRRPPPIERAFVSPAVDALLVKLSGKMARDPELACLLRNALPNTLDTTVRTGQTHDGTFIITGDINAMWLRDSANQVMPYLPFAKSDPKLAAMIAGVVRQQTQQVLADPYANAHYLKDSLTGTPNAHDDTTSPSPQCKASHGNTSYMGTRVNSMIPGIFERKFELDSLLAFLKLSRSLSEAVSSENIVPPDPFSPYDETWLEAVGVVVARARAVCPYIVCRRTRLLAIEKRPTEHNVNDGSETRQVFWSAHARHSAGASAALPCVKAGGQSALPVIPRPARCDRSSAHHRDLGSVLLTDVGVTLADGLPWRMCVSPS